MTRKPRIHFPGALYHVMARGNGGQDIFHVQQDRTYFYSLLDDTTKRFNYRIHAFCLMPNHVHIALQIGEITLSEIMQNVLSRYAKWLNKKTNTCGHLFQARYKAILVDNDSYLLELIRYIHLNPVKAKITTNPESFPWSSHLAYLGRETFPWLTTNWVLANFSNEKFIAISQYQNFIYADNNKYSQNLFKTGNQKNYDALSDDNFIEQLSKKTIIKKPNVQLSEIVKVVCEYYSIDEADLKSNSRQHFYNKIRLIIAALAKEMNITTLTAVACYFNRNITAFSRALNKFHHSIPIPDDLSNLINKLIC